MAEDEVVEEIGLSARTDCLMPAFLIQMVGYVSSTLPDDPMAMVLETMHTADGYRAFHDFCAEHSQCLRRLLSEQRIQSHHIERCGPLFPALCLVARMLEAQEVSFVDIGAAGGLHLFWDHYRYRFEPLGTFGALDSDIEVAWQWHGRQPRDPESFLRAPRVGARTGIDLAPIDISTQEGRRWLAAFGGSESRVLDAVLALGRRHAHRMLEGDCLELLPSLLGTTPPHMTSVVMHSFTTIQFSEAMNDALEAIFVEASRRRPLGRAWLEGSLDSAEPVEVRIATYTGGDVVQQTVARGALPIDIRDWFEWLGPVE